MAISEYSSERSFGRSQKHGFALGSFVQWFINSAFNTWVFSFYFSAVKLNVFWIMTAFIIWSVWNAVDDPIIGFLSDHTHTRFGRRKPYIMIAAIPLMIIEVLLWSPPLGNQFAGFMYLLIMLFCYDLFYTMVTLPYDALFPELYTSVKDRASVNTLKQIYSIFGLIAAFLIPGALIEDLTAVAGYQINGIVTSVICGITLLVSLKWGVTERKEFTRDHITQFSFLQGVKYVFKNKGFVLYTILFLFYEYLTLILSAMVPQFSKQILGTSSTLETGIILGLLFIISLITVPLWKKLDLKIGSRKGLFIAIIAYFVASIPLLVVSDYTTAVIVVGTMGLGFGGMLYYVYLIIADVIDEDELKTGVRREGTFFGITDFFMRLAGVLSYVTISLVFASSGWENYDLVLVANVELALRILVFVFPAIALVIMSICLYFYPFPKEKVLAMKAQLEELHKKKLNQVSQA